NCPPGNEIISMKERPVGGNVRVRSRHIVVCCVSLVIIIYVALRLTSGMNAQATCPCSIWDPAATPAVIDSQDVNAVELGVKFQSSVNGYITGLRFYKSAANTGIHTGSLWTTTGTWLGTVTFTNETASGWQEARLHRPVAITANTTYIAS